MEDGPFGTEVMQVRINFNFSPTEQSQARTKVDRYVPIAIAVTEIAPGRRDPPSASPEHQTRQLAERVNSEVRFDEADGLLFPFEREPTGAQPGAFAAHDVTGQ